MTRLTREGLIFMVDEIVEDGFGFYEHCGQSGLRLPRLAFGCESMRGSTARDKLSVRK
jgi:hypothetical protein